MDIVYATDDGYAMQSGISMLSLFVNNQDVENIRVFFLDNGITETNRNKLSRIAEQYHRQLVFIDVQDFEKKLDFQLDTHGFNPIVVVRLMITSFLPEDCERAVYIDGDTIVNGSLRELDEIDLGDNYIAAVPELYMPPARKKAAIDFEKNDTYYNAGVLVLNLSIWKELELEKKFLDYYKNHSDRIFYNDQDVLNACCKGSIYRLTQEYNMSTNFSYFPMWYVKKIQPAYDFSSKKAYKNYQRFPKIIHYMGDERPWNHGNFNRCKYLFKHYQDKTEWKGTAQIYGKEVYMLMLHILNVTTVFCPHFRTLVSNTIGINKFSLFGKK